MHALSLPIVFLDNFASIDVETQNLLVLSAAHKQVLLEEKKKIKWEMNKRENEENRIQFDKVFNEKK